MVDRTVEEPPPFIVLVHGPPGVGKTTLIKGLIKHYTRQDVREVKGPITLVAGKARRCVQLWCGVGWVDGSVDGDGVRREAEVHMQAGGCSHDWLPVCSVCIRGRLSFLLIALIQPPLTCIVVCAAG